VKGEIGRGKLKGYRVKDQVAGPGMEKGKKQRERTEREKEKDERGK
jgi:hypothetical protein